LDLHEGASQKKKKNTVSSIGLDKEKGELAALKGKIDGQKGWGTW